MGEDIDMSFNYISLTNNNSGNDVEIVVIYNNITNIIVIMTVARFSLTITRFSSFNKNPSRLGIYMCERYLVYLYEKLCIYKIYLFIYYLSICNILSPSLSLSLAFFNNNYNFSLFISAIF